MTDPYPPITAAKPERPTPKPSRTTAPRNYERAPTARHGLKPEPQADKTD